MVTDRLEALPEYLKSRIQVNPITGCWEWTGRTNENGYGTWGKDLAHRLVWKRLRGPIPPDRPELDHVKNRGCETRACTWPVHLEPVTHAENMDRVGLVGMAAINAEKEECDSGHRFTLGNTYIKPDGHRGCKECQRTAVARYRAKDPEATRARDRASWHRRQQRKREGGMSEHRYMVTEEDR